MSAKSWRVFGDKTIACMMLDQEVRQWIHSDLVVGPGEAAVIIKNGTSQGVITEDSRKLTGWAERNLPTFRRWLGITSDYRLIMVSTVPFELGFTVKLLTLDHEQIPGEIALECVVSTDQVSRLLALLGTRPFVTADESTEPLAETPEQSRVLVVADLIDRIRLDLMARVLQPAISAARHDEFRGNLDRLREIEEAAQSELRRALEGWGLQLNSFTIMWGLTAQEKTRIERKELQFEDETTEFNHTRRLRECERDAEVVRKELALLQQLIREEKTGEFELADMEKDAQLSAAEKEARHHLRMLQLQGEEQQCTINVRVAELAVDRERNKVELDNERAKLELAKDAREFERKQRELELKLEKEDQRELLRLEQEHELNLRRIEYDMEERITARAIAGGFVTPESLKAMYSEHTRRKAIERGEVVAQHLFGAEAAGASMTVLKETEDRERAHQRESTNLASDLMQAAKQTPTVIPVGGQMGFASGGFVATCPTCKSAVRAEWASCPACGAQLRA